MPAPSTTDLLIRAQTKPRHALPCLVGLIVAALGPFSVPIAALARRPALAVLGSFWETRLLRLIAHFHPSDSIALLMRGVIVATRLKRAVTSTMQMAL